MEARVCSLLLLNTISSFLLCHHPSHSQASWQRSKSTKNSSRSGWANSTKHGRPTNTLATRSLAAPHRYWCWWAKVKKPQCSRRTTQSTYEFTHCYKSGAGILIFCGSSGFLVMSFLRHYFYSPWMPFMSLQLQKKVGRSQGNQFWLGKL